MLQVLHSLLCTFTAFPQASAMLHETMEHMHDMQAALAPPPQEVIMDSGDDVNTISPSYYDDEYSHAEGTESNDYADEESTEATESTDTEDSGDDGNEGPEATAESPADRDDEEDNKGRRDEGGRGEGRGRGGRGPNGDKGRDSGSSRRKRQAYEDKYLEVRVLSDVDMFNYHGADGVIPYTLTLMNIVSMVLFNHI